MAENEMDPAIEKIIKGGECWLELTIERRSKGIEVWVRADPRVEEFIKSIATPDVSDTLESYGKAWASMDPTEPIQVLRLENDLTSHFYNLEYVGGSLANKSNSNLSFFRFVGVGSPDGVRFRIAGPINKTYITTMKDAILGASRQMIRDYVAPVHISLRITSTNI